jgi:hypothetical protein
LKCLGPDVSQLAKFKGGIKTAGGKTVSIKEDVVIHVGCRLG